MAKRSGEVGAAYRAARAKPRVRLSREDIVGAAVHILDTDGPDALTFRRLAADLGAGVGSLYWHVDSKEVLLQLAFDRVLGGLDASVFGDDSQPWAQRLRSSSTAFWRMLRRHRWAPHQASASRDRGPRLLAYWDQTAQILLDAGFGEEDAFYALAAISSYVIGLSAAEANWHQQQAGALTRDEAIAQAATFFDGLDAEEFPATKRLAPIFISHDEETQFMTGIDLLIGGLQARLAARQED